MTVVRLWALSLAICAAPTLFATPTTFTTGNVFWANVSSPNLFNILANGDQSALSPFASLAGSGSYQAGQMAFSADLTSAYVSVLSDSTVLAITASGGVSTFAYNVPDPTGVIRTSDGRILVSSFYSGKIFDITAGGDFAGKAAFATGLVNPRNMVQTASGILVADQGNGKIVNIGTGGDLSTATAFAYGLAGPVSLALFNGSLYASGDDHKVIDITSGGNQSGATPFASGRPFFGLTVAGDRLLAASNYAMSRGSIWDISSGGNFASTDAWVSNLSGDGGTLFEVVPALVAPQPPVTAAVPEPGTLALAGLGLLYIARRIRIARS